MKKDIIQLALFPALILGLLGFTSSVQLLRFISHLMGFRFDLMSEEGLWMYSLAVAALFALCPMAALFLYLRKYQGNTIDQPITFHIRYLVYLGLGVLVSLVLDISRIKYFRSQLEELSAEAINWTSYVEELNPFPYGVPVLVVMSAAIFFTQKIATNEN